MGIHQSRAGDTWLARVDPEVAAVLDTIPALDLADIPLARAQRAELARASIDAAASVPGVSTRVHRVPGLTGRPEVEVRVHRPVGGPDTAAVVLWIHGGGHVMGSADQDDPFLREMVSVQRCTAVAVEWRHAPQWPYPAAIEDCYAVLRWLHDHGPAQGLNPDQIVVAGASSGGGLAAGLALLTRDRGEVALAAQVLIYPMLDDRSITASSRYVTDERIWNHRSNDLAWRAYLGSLSGSAVPSYAAPARAEDLSGLPWTWLATGELDLFVDEDVDYANRLRDAGVSTELVVYRGAVHGFDVFAPEAAVSRRFRADRTVALGQALALQAR